MGGRGDAPLASRRREAVPRNGVTRPLRPCPAPGGWGFGTEQLLLETSSSRERAGVCRFCDFCARRPPERRRYPVTMPQGYGALEKVLRAGEGRRLKTLAEQAAYITSLEPEFEALSDDELRGKTAEFRQRHENGESLEDMLFEAFACVREARKRESDQRIFDVQLMGGIVLHEGDIAEMKTGEGKTFVASLPLYLNACSGRERPPRHGQRLPREARRGVEPRRLRAARRVGRLHREHDALRDPHACLRVRHHLRHELRVRLRLPPRQHGRVDGGRRPARPRVCDRGRGRLDPDRRGADAADHLRRARDSSEHLLRLRPHRQGARGRPVQAAVEDRPAGGAGRRLHVRREVQDDLAAPARASTRSSARCGSTTSTTRATSSSSTTSCSP